MRVAIIGRTEILYDTAEFLRAAGHTITCILTAKEAPEYTKTPVDFERLASTLRVPFVNSARIESQSRMLRESKSDVAVSINYSGIIPKSITDLFPLGILNAHGGDLPRYRGNACQAWAILNGEDKIGLCIHRMIGGELDSGDIIGRDYFKVSNATKVTQVWDWMNKRTPTLFLEAIVKLTENPSYILESQSKNPLDTLRCYPRRPEDGCLNWQQSAFQILRLINASNKPYSGAFCQYEGKHFIIWDAELVSEFENLCAVPGQVTMVGRGFIDVACGKGKIRILLAEYDGHVSTPDFWIKSIRKRLN
jgi:methionyl-tRNA formyltransferase